MLAKGSGTGELTLTDSKGKAWKVVAGSAGAWRGTVQRVTLTAAVAPATKYDLL
jgi:hypothetical protein